MKTLKTEISAPLAAGEMLAALQRGLELGPLTVQATITDPCLGEVEVDAIVDVIYGKRRFEFVAEIKARSTPRAFEDAVRTVNENIRSLRTAKGPATMGSPSKRKISKTWRPLVMIPYLSDDQIETLERLELSGIDLCGNGNIVVPNELYVCRYGRPNLYPESWPTKYAYRGATSLVPRVFLSRPVYNQVSQIEAEIAARGGSVTLSTVSKALKRMQEDALVSRRGTIIRLLQPESVLDKLRESYQPPKVLRRRELAVTESLQNLFATLPTATDVVVGGASSVARYAVMGREDRTVVYGRDIEAIANAWTSYARAPERFVDIELRESFEPWLYFDVRRDGGIPYSCPVQVYLELALGDKRERQAADQVRSRILEEVSAWTSS